MKRHTPQAKDVQAEVTEAFTWLETSGHPVADTPETRDILARVYRRAYNAGWHEGNKR